MAGGFYLPAIMRRSASNVRVSLSEIPAFSASRRESSMPAAIRPTVRIPVGTPALHFGRSAWPAGAFGRLIRFASS